MLCRKGVRVWIAACLYLHWSREGHSASGQRIYQRIPSKVDWADRTSWEGNQALLWTFWAWTRSVCLQSLSCVIAIMSIQASGRETAIARSTNRLLKCTSYQRYHSQMKLMSQTLPSWVQDACILQVKDAARQYRVYYTKTDDTSDYLVDHSIIMYLINPEGAFVTFYGKNFTAEQLAISISEHIQSWQSQHS